jgi:homocysteine S-methyltransferase
MAAATVGPFAGNLERQGLLILDGGLATQLEAAGRTLDPQLWSAGALLEAPHEIRAVHHDYLVAGADCLITASYQATIAAFRRRGLSDAAAADLLRLSTRLAIEARDDFWSRPENRIGRVRPLVAASIGPYGAALADGSEYRGGYGVDDATLDRFHRRRLLILAASGADLLAVESIPDRAEALVLRRLLLEAPGASAWFSFTCRDGARLSDGTPLADMLAEFDEDDPVVAFGVNCTAPRFIRSLIASARGATRLPIVVYPNSGETYDAASKGWGGNRSPVEFADAARDWVDAGARIIGGCCRTGPDHIERIRRQLLPG